MEIKKSLSADLEGKKGTGLLMGFVLALSAMFVAFEWTQHDKKVIETEPVFTAAIEEDVYKRQGYDRASELFWTVTENALKADGRVAEPGAGHGVCLRLQSFGRDGLPRASYAYPLDMPESEAKGKQYADVYKRQVLGPEE